MSLIVVDVEADGPYPIGYSMVCFGAVIISGGEVGETFHGKTAPISDEWIPDALKVSGFTREEHKGFPDPEDTMREFSDWLRTHSKGKPVFISDNPAFDWQWINTYFHMYTGNNPFGFSARRIGDLYCGMQKDMSRNSEWKKKYRITAHDHNPVNDAKGNAEALIAMRKLGLKMNT